MIRAAAIAALLAVAAPPALAGALEDIHARGVVICGVPAQSPGIAKAGAAGRQGLAIDLCSMLAAAVLGKPGATAFVEVTPEDASVTLQAAEADVLLVARDWRFAQEAAEGILLVQPLFHRPSDGAVFGPAVRQGDDPWFVAVRWLLFALQADGLPPEAVQQGAAELGLNPEWETQIRAGAKNYAALLERHRKELQDAGWEQINLPLGARW